MKSFPLTLLIIVNLLAVNMASAFNMHDEITGSTSSHLTQAHDESKPSNSVDGLSCDHSCHFSAHVVGLISCITLLSMMDTSTLVAIQDEDFYSLVTGPPLQPPQV